MREPSADGCGFGERGRRRKPPLERGARRGVSKGSTPGAVFAAGAIVVAEEASSRVARLHHRPFFQGTHSTYIYL
jgi:hypothetical protein